MILRCNTKGFQSSSPFGASFLKVRQAGNYSRPLVLDADFFRRLQRLISEVGELGCNLVASGQNLSKKELTEKIENLPHSTTDLKTEGEIEQFYIVRSLKNSVENARSRRFELQFENGFSFESNDLDQLIELLETETDPASSFVTRLGIIGPVSLDIHMQPSLSRVVRYNIEGPKHEVTILNGQVIALLKSSMPDYPLLHSPYFAIILRLIVTVSAVLSAIYLFRDSFAQNPAMAFWVSAFGLIGFLISEFPARLARQNFPQLTFDIGPHSKKRKARVTLILAVITIIVAPWLINLIG